MKASENRRNGGALEGTSGARGRRRGHSLAAALLAALLSAGLASSGRADPEVTQTFELRPGWNAIYLEVQPEPRDPATVFAGLPVGSVWTWARRVVSAEFVQDPDETSFARAGWLGFFPPSRPESFTSNLFEIQVNRPYLVKIEGSQTVSWSVSGRPSLRPLRWTPDAFTLVGLPVDGAAPPSFAEFFAGSPAHAGQPIFRLSGGSWEAVADPAATPIASGEAYWIFTAGGSEHQGPIAVELLEGDGLDYGRSVLAQTVRVRRDGSGGGDVALSIRDADVPLSYETLADVVLAGEPAREIAWLPLDEPLLREVGPGGEVAVNLAVRRAEFAAQEVASVLEISDGAGVRWRVPVEARRGGPVAAAGARAAVQASASELAGLWIGEAVLDAVSESSPALGAEDPTAPTPTASEFALRLLIHVDENGQARLLDDVIQLWEEGTLAPVPDLPGYDTLDRPGRPVLVTDPALIPAFTGVTLRDGDPVGRRVSSAAFDLEAGPLALAGAGFGQPGGVLTATLVDPVEGRTNPFRHGYHPDHDNLDAAFASFEPEAYEVTRELELRFADRDPALTQSSAPNPPEWGWSLVGGVYRETLSGLHANPIVVQGSFRLRRADETSELDPEPLP